MFSELQLVVLDMAGTTVRDEGQVPRAFQDALAIHGLHATPEEIAAVRGTSKREAIPRFVPSGPDAARRAETVYASFQHRLCEIYQQEGVREVAGAAAVMTALRARGVRVALNTGFDRAITQLLLSALGWSQGATDATNCSDDVASGRPAPDMIWAAMKATGVADAQKVMNVGDTVKDLQAGSAAGVRWNVGVLSGAHDRAKLQAAGPTHLIASVADLPALAL